jgi:hypothetical protein
MTWADIVEMPAPSNKKIKPIETIYNGYRFRSRLEARWAVFFDALGVEYEYEPEGFELPNGGRYLPDFRVKCYGKRGVCREPKTMDDARSYGLCYACRFGNEDSYAYEIDCYNKDMKRDDYGGVDGAKIDGDANNICVKCDGFKLDTGDPFDLYIEVKGFMTDDDARRIKEFSKSYPVLVVGNIPSRFRDIEWEDGMNGTNVYPFNYDTIDGDYFGAYPAAHNGHFYLMGADSNYINRCDIDSIDKAYAKARQARFEHGETPKVMKRIERPMPWDECYVIE